ncbi:hypothetical protein SAMN04490202_1587 [Pseudomonas reinekei]|uniref:Uncharacterized protein n=1 Tax=Pseudomonas reinekei TaxID=395598 RepID=A0A1H0LPZ5_PSERE|nr:hypothetical protein [Pseudomonas reinekei]KAB0484035.1 hypothetical protein F7R15_18595 [Pseudomonas reinekei]OLU02975.1 hypothetical protein BVK86_11730 [Pseudomonas reinekei]SDO70066.1 hypothetical protein SAMN04490202_1587 [Pseudomonas reinekei]
MTPTFLPHQALDLFGALEASPSSTAEIKGRQRLLALRDQAIAAGAQVLVVLWQNLEWTLLAVQPPADVVINDARELIPNLLRNPEALQQIRQRADQGSHLQWLTLVRPVTTLH